MKEKEPLARGSSFYKVENSSTSSLKRCNALSIGSGVVKSTPAFSVDLMDNLNFHL